MDKKVFLIVGDAFMRRAEYDELLPKLQGKSPDTCEIQSFDLSDSAMGPILSAARSLPFLSESQILRVKQAERLKEDGLDELEAYLKSPFEKTFLIFEADRSDEKNRLTKLIQSYGLIIRPMASDRLRREVQFLKVRLSESKKTITPNAQKHLIEMCGESPVFLGSMLDRLILFAGDQTEITEAMTGQFEEDWGEAKIFDLSDAILARDLNRSLHVLNKLLEIEGDFYSLLGFIHSQIKKLWQAKVLISEGLAPSQAAVRLGMKSPAAANHFFRALEKFELKKLENAVNELHQLDQNAKTGRGEAIPALEMWLIKLTAPTASLQMRSRG